MEGVSQMIRRPPPETTTLVSCPYCEELQEVPIPDWTKDEARDCEECFNTFKVGVDGDEEGYVEICVWRLEDE
jgi:hypothetical protein